MPHILIGCDALNHICVKFVTPICVKSIRVFIYFFQFMDDDTYLYKCLETVDEMGVALLKNAPTQEELVLELANRVAIPKSTSFGWVYKSFTVGSCSLKQATSIWYTVTHTSFII